jgi:23S rRNA (cytosine1962-C5)-methyltransferase
MNERKVFLKPGKDKALRNRHHWIFSGAVMHLPDFSDGEMLSVYSAEGDMLGTGYFNRKAKIIGRMVAFDDVPPLEAIRSHLDAAIHLRKQWFQNRATDAYRLVNGEGDQLPGLIVDKYRDVLVIQISTLGMDKLRDWIADYLVNALSPRVIYEKSLLPSRKEEGLEETQGVLFGGSVADDVEICENGLRFLVPIVQGQKTGFFLDHREMRQMVRELSKNKRVLNCFAYTGGFSVYAAAGGASHVDSVDISKLAMRVGHQSLALNNFSFVNQRFIVADVFHYLRENPLDYDLVILDPPAFAKKKKDVISACRGYKDINRIAMQKMPINSLLLTSSCSYYVDDALFQKVVFQASVEAGRDVRIIGRHRMAPDHPINICHPESDYLKSLLLYIR